MTPMSRFPLYAGLYAAVFLGFVAGLLELLWRFVVGGHPEGERIVEPILRRSEAPDPSTQPPPCPHAPEPRTVPPRSPQGPRTVRSQSKSHLNGNGSKEAPQ
jgi:hypothetical protein